MAYSAGRALRGAREAGMPMPKVEDIDGLYEVGWYPRKGQLVMAAGRSGSQKRQPLYSRIPVPVSDKFPSGWATIGQLEVGDSLFGLDGQVEKVIRLSPITRGDVYEVTLDDGRKVRAGGDHLWLASTDRMRKQGAPEKVVDTETMMRSLARPAAKPGEVNANWALPRPHPVNGPRADLPVDPYVVGLFLGDGSRRGAGLTTMDPELVDAVVDAGYPVRRVENKKGNRAKTYFFDGLQSDLKVALGFERHPRSGASLITKRIPPEYLRASDFQRLCLLQGLMDTDGSCNPSGNARFAVTDPDLASDVLELARSLGLKAYRNENPAAYTKDGTRIVTGTAYWISFTDTMPVFRLARKSQHVPSAISPRQGRLYVRDIRVVANEEMRCITVSSPDGMYLTEDFVPTHNSGFALWLVHKWGLPTIYFSADMSQHTASTRLAGLISDMTSDEVGRLLASDDIGDEYEAGQLIKSLNASPVKFAFDSEPSLDDIDAEVDAWVEVNDEYPTVIVIDNLLDVEPISDSEFSSHKGILLELKTLARRTGAMVLVLHHSRDEGDSNYPAGSKGIVQKVTQTPETILSVALEPSGDTAVFRVAVVKQRSGRSDPSGATYAELVATPAKTRFRGMKKANAWGSYG